MVYRLYLIKSDTGNSTGKKRDYPSELHFKKYGVETYHRYNKEYFYRGKITGTEAKLCLLNDENKWERVSEEELKRLLKL